MPQNDTIVAIATAQVAGAIAIIRLSGAQALPITNQLFNRDITQAASHTIQYGHIVHPTTRQVIDEVLISLFRAPHSYTCEDVVEINCHGGVAVTQTILGLLLNLGARLAEQGEFTKRAFLNGRIDLTQAEAVADLINAEHQKAAQVSVDNLDGKLSRQIQDFRARTIDILAGIEVNIDYPEYDDVEQLTSEILVPKITQLMQNMDKLLQTAHTGQVLKNGVKTAIIGRPNVGKSSLLNVLLREQKAIVTEIAGTTRDIVEGHIHLGDITLHIIDTAGIRTTTDRVEQIGVQKSHAVLASADLVLLVLDGSVPLTTEDQELIAQVQNKQHIILINKSDLPSAESLPTAITDQALAISAQADYGIDQLYDRITTVLQLDINMTNQVYLTNIRHTQLLQAARDSLAQAKVSAEMALPIDIITIDLQETYNKLGEILGIALQDDLLNTLFANFCLGK